jgi:hypothetical protein
MIRRIARSTRSIRRIRAIRSGCLVACACAAGAGSVAAPLAESPSCRASSGREPPRVVELYTSEGCSSCPPADRWLSTLKGRGDVIALGFHVHYWDRLGWPDRFASKAYTERQYAHAARAGANSVYTPQVLVDGRDWRGWPALPAAQRPASAPPAVVLAREADGHVTARVEPVPDAAATLQGYWAVLEDRHVSRVRAGENAGETLEHDHVVRLLRPLPAWPARAGTTSRLDIGPGVPEHPRRFVLVVTEGAGERPLQAVVLGC